MRSWMPSSASLWSRSSGGMQPLRCRGPSGMGHRCRGRWVGMPKRAKPKPDEQNMKSPLEDHQRSPPFAGLRVIDTTHVLAGPFAAYQLAVLGADVIKVESPREPDQARAQGSDRRLSDTGMGTMFLAQASNK